jgi:DNA-binding transcriptional regulator YiaG
MTNKLPPLSSKGWAEWCSAMRILFGLTQSEAAAKVPGLSVRTWQDWESGRSEPPVWAQHLIVERLANKDVHS